MAYSVAQDIANKIARLSQNAETITHIPLQGAFKNKFKLRIGDWRAMYSIDRESGAITIYSVKHRSEIYKI
jgi:mRNA interferase RelE/StbE